MLIFRMFTQFLMEAPEIPAGAGTEPVVPEAVAPAPVPTPAVAGDAPWAADLAALGLDDTGRSAVDQYLRTKVQPHTTKLETDLAQLAPARDLYTDLSTQPLETFLAVGEQLFEGADLDKLKAALGIEPDAPVVPAAPTQELDPRVAKLIADDEAREAQQHWDTSIAPLKAADPSITDELFAPFVVATNGDFDAAKVRWDAHVAGIRGVQPAAELTPEQLASLAAPGVIGTGDGGGTAPPPVEAKYATLSDAFDAAMDEAKAARVAPAVV